MDYSIIICTYNVDPRILLRCFRSVALLLTDGLQTEVIVADNNSHTPPDSVAGCSEYLRLPGWTLIHEPRQGVQFARITAIKHAIGKQLVYIDADNEPAPDYLLKLDQLIHVHPETGAWGPGIVEVDFIDGIDPAIEQYARTAFQERHETSTRTARVDDWQSCYPFGTGLCTRADILRQYVLSAEDGQFSMEGRSGGKLTSCEDTQMVLLCIKMGYAAGVSPNLKLTHMIPAARANEKYLRRLAYGTSLCYATCLIQVFGEKKSLIQQQRIPRTKLVRKCLKEWLQLSFTKAPLRSVELAFFIGNSCSKYLALGESIPAPLKFIAKRLKLY